VTVLGMPWCMERENALVRSSGAVEVTIYALLGVVLIGAAVVLIGQSVYRFVDSVGDGVVDAARQLLDTLLLTFIFVELFGAIRATLREQRLIAEPFFLVGIIAGIKEIVLLIGTKDLSTKGSDIFRQGMIEVGVLTGVVAVLTLCTFIIRRSQREPAEASE
jgi:uncharacterized membrane protein (DUF373 family)